jgi:GNAT superfamily N-acetyltransferase
MADLHSADQLRALAGWNQTPADWERFIRYAPEACFLAEWEGEPVGTVTTTAYGTELGWIGMMLVHPDYRRRGIAKALMRRAMESLGERQVRCIKLDATPAGEPVYRQLGFLPEWELQRWERAATPGNDRLDAMPPHPRPLSPEAEARGEAGTRPLAELALVAGMDRQAFGADRMDWLRRLASASGCVVRERGYGMLRPGVLADYLGPIVADNDAVAAELIGGLLGETSRRVFWDIPRPNSAAEALAAKLGLKPVRSLLRMWMGEASCAGDPRLQYAIGDPATG